MSSPSTDSSSKSSLQKSCPNCGESIDGCLRYCAVCSHDIGFPNVREAEAPSEVAALQLRFNAAKADANTRGIKEQFDSFVSHVESDSFVLVSMPPVVALQLLQDSRSIYTNYERLVEGGHRSPAPSEFDTHRASIAGRLFGSYAREIRYGVLAIDSEGLSNYGRVTIRLSSVSVAQRVSFLHENSYSFVQNHCPNACSVIPHGYRGTWKSRHVLAGAKIERQLNQSVPDADWPRLVLRSSPSRTTDDFIEAHIFGGFNNRAIHSVICHRDGASRNELVQLDLVSELWASFCRGSKT